MRRLRSGMYCCPRRGRLTASLWVHREVSLAHPCPGGPPRSRGLSGSGGWHVLAGRRTVLPLLSRRRHEISLFFVYPKEKLVFIRATAPHCANTEAMANDSSFAWLAEHSRCAEQDGISVLDEREQTSPKKRYAHPNDHAHAESPAAARRRRRGHRASRQTEAERSLELPEI